MSEIRANFLVNVNAFLIRWSYLSWVQGVWETGSMWKFELVAGWHIPVSKFAAMELRWANLQDHEAGPEFREVHWIWKLEFNRLFECKSWFGLWFGTLE